MDNNISLSVIHKKAQVAREDFDARAMSPAKALRLAVAKVADEMFDLALSVSTLEQSVEPATTMLRQMDEESLLMLLDGAGGACAAASLDCQVVSSLIEMQISGAVRSEEAATRKYTRTDAAMLAPLIDTVLAVYDAQLAEDETDYEPRSFRFGDKVEDTRALSLVLGDGRFDVFRMTLDIAEGARTGVICIAMPNRSVGSAGKGLRGENAFTSMASLEKLALEAAVPLDAVLARVHHPLDELCSLKPGMLLPLPSEVLSRSELVAQPRHVVAKVKLGQANGMRAIRVIMSNAEDDPDEPEQDQFKIRLDEKSEPEVHLKDVTYSGEGMSMPAMPDNVFPSDTGLSEAEPEGASDSHRENHTLTEPLIPVDTVVADPEPV